MQELWSSASYEPHLLSLPFAFAPAAMTIVIAYALVMRGASRLRRWLLLHFFALLPYAITMTLSPSMVSAGAAEAWFRIAAACVPMAAAAGAGFQFELLGRYARTRWFVWAGLAQAVVWIVLGATTDAAVRGVRWLPAGLWFADVGAWAWLALVTTLIASAPGFIALGVVAVTSPPSLERRQLRLVLAANLVTYAGLTDVALGYGIGYLPLGWLLSGIGSLLVVRALVVEDLLRVRAVDTTAPRLVLHLAAAIVLAWVAMGMLGSNRTWWGTTLELALAFAGVRVTLAVIGLVNRGARGREGTLDRLIAQLVARARTMRDESEVARLAADVVQLGLGLNVSVFLAAAEDWGWNTAAGARIDDALAPDPLLVGWLAEQRGTMFVDELAYAPDSVRGLVAHLFEAHDAYAIVPVASHDELVALIVVPSGGATPRLRSSNLQFLERAGERLGEAIVHVRMMQRAAERASIAREVELAAAVQAQLLPGRGPHVCGDVTIVGSWWPATRCAGDFWGVYPLDDRGRVLVAIGDVTGHGVASATVTAAAAAAFDVSVRRAGSSVDLAELVGALDVAVRRVGRGELQMTCFASILDPEARTISYVSCGQTTPYVCHAGDQDIELTALVGRGNPLGGSAPLAAKVLQRPLRAGDLVVWYTDGVIEAEDPAGEVFGDRRLQRMLRRLERANLSPSGVHDIVHAAVAAHRAGRPRGDDETLVVAQWRPPRPSATELAREVASS